MNQSGMTRNPIENWQLRNTMQKATWAGKEGQRGAPVEMMVALANMLNSDAWFSMPHRANDGYVRQFAEYVAANLKPDLRVYIEYSNEVWNNIFIHRQYAMDQGIARGLDTDPKAAAIKFQAQRSLEIFNSWHDVFGEQKDRVIRTLSGWSANKRLTSQLLSWNSMHRNVDAFAIAPYFYADLDTLRGATHVDEIFAAMLNDRSRYGLAASIKQINEQAEMAKAFGVHLIAYEGGQHLVDWETRKLDQHPNPLLLATNRDSRMGELYQRYLSAWEQTGASVFIHFSAPRIPGWFGSWGAKEYISQPRNKAPKYDALLRHIGK